MKTLILILTFVGILFACKKQEPQVYCWNCKTSISYEHLVPMVTIIGQDTIPSVTITTLFDVMIYDLKMTDKQMEMFKISNPNTDCWKQPNQSVCPARVITNK